jgi:hypothetical protein
MKKYFKSHGHYDLTKGVVRRFWKKPLYKITNQILYFGSNLTPTPTPNPTATPTPTPQVFGSSGFQWMTINSVTSNTASGIGQNDITVAITQSGGGMGELTGMYAANSFPAEYGVPFNGTQIKNTQSGIFTATFSSPVTDALVAFASVGNPSLSVPVQVSTPFTPIWSTATTYQNPVNATQYNQFTGAEGFNIIRIDGTVSSITFNYTVSETYCTVCFGFVDQNTLPTPTPTSTTLTPTPTPPTQLPVDCVVSAWGAWSACSQTCDGGTQTHTRSVLVAPANGGSACPALSESRSCNTQPCSTPTP